MGRFVGQRWEANPSALGPRRARIGGTYQAFIPNPIADLPLSLDARIAADISDAERAIFALNAASPTDRGPHQLEVLARMLLRAEAVGSSQVEGLVISPRKLALADLDPALDATGRALEVVANIRALQEALRFGEEDGAITVDTLSNIHERLMAGTRDASLGGVIRTEQNWIGGTTPVDAEFVPPPHTQVPGLLDDLCAYASGDAHPPLVQAAVAHAQFETIHPFADGNGRTGRALLQLILRRRGLCPRFVPPISLVLATWSKRYVEALTGTRVVGKAGDPNVAAGLEAWLELVAQAARLACRQAQTYDERIIALVDQWRSEVLTSVGPLRADAAIWPLLELLPAAPLITAKTATALTGRSERAIDGAMAQLVEAGVLKQVGGRQRYRLFEAVGAFDLVTDAERALASPTGDTKHAKPARPVPHRRS